MATDQPQVFGIPAQVLSVDDGVIDCDVLRFPERVLGLQFGVADDDILAILEGIIARQVKMVDFNVPAMHKDIIALLCFDIFHPDVPAFPKRLVGVGKADAGEFQPVHLPEHLGRFHQAVAHFPVPGIPDGGAGPFREVAVPDGEAVTFPEGVFPLETAADGLDVRRFLDGGLAGVDGDLLQI